MTILWLSAALFSSSEQANCGTKRVTCTSLRLAIRMARCLLMVDKPPLDEFHSLARRVTFKVLSHFAGWPPTDATCEVLVTDGAKSFWMMTSNHHYTGKVCHFPSTMYKNRFNWKKLLLLKKTCLFLSLHESINQTERNELVECVQTCLESPKKLVTQLQNIQLHTVFPLLNYFRIYDTIISQSVQIFSKLGIPIHTTAIAQLYHNSYHNFFLIGFRYYL